MTPVYTRGLCAMCGVGGLAFRLCSDHRTLVIMCEECDSVWLDPRETDAGRVTYPSAPAFVIPGTALSVARPEARWATNEEVQEAGFLDLVEE